MTFMNSNANIKQFQLIKFINENCNDDHVITRISIVLRRDKIEAPYLDILNHSRMHNLTEEKYNEIKSLIIDAFDDNQRPGQIEISKKNQELKVVLMSKNDDEMRILFENYGELFEKIDNLTD